MCDLDRLRSKSELKQISGHMCSPWAWHCWTPGLSFRFSQDRTKFYFSYKFTTYQDHVPTSSRVYQQVDVALPSSTIADTINPKTERPSKWCLTKVLLLLLFNFTLIVNVHIIAGKITEAFAKFLRILITGDLKLKHLMFGKEISVLNKFVDVLFSCEKSSSRLYNLRCPSVSPS